MEWNGDVHISARVKLGSCMKEEGGDMFDPVWANKSVDYQEDYLLIPTQQEQAAFHFKSIVNLAFD